MRSSINANVNVIINGRADRMNVAGIQLHRVLLGRLRFYLRSLASTLRHRHRRTLKHGYASQAAAMMAAAEAAPGCPWQRMLPAFACTT